MKCYDISMEIQPTMQVWEDIKSKKPKFDTKTFGHVTDTTLTLNAHTGTHIDAPLHMINDAETFESIAIERLVRDVKVLHLGAAKDGITRQDLEAHTIKKNDFLLLKTNNSDHSSDHFDYEFIYLTEEAANYLIEKEIEGVGIDTLGIERSQEGNPTHRNLFGNNIIIIEGLRLKEIAPGNYFMVAAPLKLIGTEAAPARVLLFDQKQL
ncbi:cyclase family protein [Gracilibacillus caseinilyticus]|uniref:Cyclase family protein n=2 Tax=Gracilibacillus caseinilyticus TaxID=2932256 RepID=A0ABY4F7Q9_9BACI|nr:cyclase family protein [Gracilibacillus caseinilyticus]UOQ50486.1 cyclase family protein [Gracilibacillus caseinilyticus]